MRTTIAPAPGGTVRSSICAEPARPGSTVNTFIELLPTASGVGGKRLRPEARSFPLGRGGTRNRVRPVTLTTRTQWPRASASATCEMQWRVHMGRAAILWLLGIPIPILLLMWVLGWLG
jgi:hypothetical protein